MWMTDSQTLEKTEIWRRHEYPDGYEQYFFFPKFTMNLNNLSETLKPILCPTDCWFRPDQWALEEGDLDLGRKEKHWLEEK